MGQAGDQSADGDAFEPCFPVFLSQFGGGLKIPGLHHSVQGQVGLAPIVEGRRRHSPFQARGIKRSDVGHVFFAEVFVRARDGVDDLPRRVREAMAGARGLDWRLHDVTFVPVDDLDGADEGLRDG